MSLIIHESNLRFSGHDTFHCREQWILKGLQLIVNEGSAEIFKTNEAIPKLGVGKNMVRSIYHWLKAFDLLNKQNEINELANLLFIEELLDPYMEKEGTLWLLQYQLCQSRYASIFKIIFSNFFSDKATLEFSESQIFYYVNRELKAQNQKTVTAKTFNSDFKVFIRTYVSPLKNEKTVEDDFNAPMLSLNLVSDTGRRNDHGESVYRINRATHEIPLAIFVYSLLTEFESEASINFDDIRRTVGSYLCLSNDGLEKLIDDTCESYKEFVYKDDAGVRQLQVKNIEDGFKSELLRDYYENEQ